MQYIFYVLFFQFTIFCNQYNTAKALTGPLVRNAGDGELLFTMSIQYVDEAGSSSSQSVIGHQCTGTLISRSTLLTVAHCIQGRTLEQIRIMGGSNDLRTCAVFSPFWWINYNEYAELMHIALQHQTNDIVYLKLTTLVPDHIVHAHLTNLTTSEIRDATVTVAGWSRAPDGDIMFKLKKTLLFTLRKEDCDRGLSQLSHMQINTDDRMICSFNAPPISFDDGDNGAPTILGQYELVAMGIGSCYSSIVGSTMVINLHYTIYFYMDFIQYMLNNF